MTFLFPPSASAVRCGNLLIFHTFHTHIYILVKFCGLCRVPDELAQSSLGCLISVYHMREGRQNKTKSDLIEFFTQHSATLALPIFRHASYV